MSTRRDTHAGSWYTKNGDQLGQELDEFLAKVQPSDEQDIAFPVSGCKAIIAPHAGYSYSGPTAAWAYKSIDTTGIKRVFILGPAHYIYLDGCSLSQCAQYQTPLGVLPLDTETIMELRATNAFLDMTIGEDEEEHSIELHLPFVRKIFSSQDIKIVPILVGAINKEKEAQFGRLLAPYLLREDTFCVVSSDFCHWGTRFDYTRYYSGDSLIVLSPSRQLPPEVAQHPIYESIRTLDQEAISVLSIPPTAPKDVHEAFSTYLKKTKNTICGRHPIGLLLGSLEQIEADGKIPTMKWVRYEQSSKCVSLKDSSVSYASAFVKF